MITDHNPLRWLREQKYPRHTFARWLLELEDIPYKIVFRPGYQNQLPDYLRRVPDLEIDDEVNDEEAFEEKVCYIESQKEEVQPLEMQQKEDAAIQIAVRQLKKGELTVG